MSAFLFVANQTAIDFANTEIIQAGKRVDLLDSFDSLLRWLLAAGLLDEPTKRRVARRFSDEAMRVAAVADARRLRRAIATLVEQATTNRTPGEAVVGDLNRVLMKAETCRELVHTPGGWALNVRSNWDTSAKLLLPVAESAADLLVQGNLSFIRKCENPECILHLYDTSKNHTRRWCSMTTCGNRHKVQAYRERVRRDAPPL